MHKRLSAIVARYSQEEVPFVNGLPTNPLCDASLRLSLDLIRILGSFQKFGKPAVRALSPKERCLIASEAANVLSDWPKSFYACLEAMLLRPSKQYQLGCGVLSQLSDFLRPLFGGDTEATEGPTLFSWIQSFLSTHWKGEIGSVVKKRLIEAGLPPKWVGLERAARTTGVGLMSLQNAVKLGKIRHRKGVNCAIELYFEDLTSDSFRPTKVLNVSEAAEKVGIPMAVLRLLRRSSFYHQTFFGRGASGYAVRDLTCLISLFKNAKAIPNGGGPTISLTEIMRSKRFRAFEKENVVANIISGNIQIRAPISLRSWHEVRLLRKDFENISGALLVNAESGWSVTQGANALRMRKSTFASLLQLGVIATASGMSEIRVEPKSVIQFSADYFRINSLDSEHLIRKLMVACDQANIKYLRAANSQYFMKRADFQRVVKDPAFKNRFRYWSSKGATAIARRTEIDGAYAGSTAQLPKAL